MKRRWNRARKYDLSNNNCREVWANDQPTNSSEKRRWNRAKQYERSNKNSLVHEKVERGGVLLGACERPRGEWARCTHANSTYLQARCASVPLYLLIKSHSVASQHNSSVSLLPWCGACVSFFLCDTIAEWFLVNDFLWEWGSLFLLARVREFLVNDFLWECLLVNDFLWECRNWLFLLRITSTTWRWRQNLHPSWRHMHF